jgi:hypothetical protein
MQTQAFEMPPAFFARSNARAARRATPRGLQWAMTGVLVAGGLAVLACLVAPEQMLFLGPPTPLLIAGVVVGILMILIAIRQRGLAAEYNRSAVRAGLWQASIVESGLIMRGAHVETLFRWGAMTDIHHTAEGLQVMMGGLAHVPIPLAAFADVREQQAFHEAIRAGISAKGDGS